MEFQSGDCVFWVEMWCDGLLSSPVVAADGRLSMFSFLFPVCWCPGVREQIAGTSETGGDYFSGRRDT